MRFVETVRNQQKMCLKKPRRLKAKPTDGLAAITGRQMNLKTVFQTEIFEPPIYVRTQILIVFYKYSSDLKMPQIQTIL